MQRHAISAFAKAAVTLGLLLSLCFSTAHADAPPCAQPVQIGWSSQPPYQMADEHDNPSGFDYAILTTVLHGIGCGYQITRLRMSWDQQLAAVANGQVDVIMGASKTPERESYAWFSKPYRQELVALYVRKGESAQLPLASLHDITKPTFGALGISQGTYYGRSFEQWKQEPEFRRKLRAMPSDEEAVNLLIGHQVDGVLIDVESGTWYLRQEGLLGNNIERHPLPAIATGSVHFMFSRKTISNAVVSRFDRQLELIRTNGDYDAIARQYRK